MSKRPLLTAHRRILGSGGEDPLEGVANLFDAAMVFAVALLLAFVAFSGARGLTAEGGLPPDERTKSIDRFRATSAKHRGRGARLGVAYRLESGEVVYVPD